ncbi:hypothetical protein ACODT5_16615 [Streptomyces sp. 5.8]|uniref:hypothetical protein n=1 Tax=Streptomyces sp. 5.8 TaxID=3406571 RepID=UPI003BB5AF4D
MRTQTFTIPPVRTRFRWRMNPHHSPEMDAEANAWAFGLFSDDPRVPAPVHADNYTTWAALCFPDVDPDLLTRWCRFNALYTVVENKQEALYETSGARQHRTAVGTHGRAALPAVSRRRRVRRR